MITFSVIAKCTVSSKIHLGQCFPNFFVPLTPSPASWLSIDPHPSFLFHRRDTPLFAHRKHFRRKKKLFQNSFLCAEKIIHGLSYWWMMLTRGIVNKGMFLMRMCSGVRSVMSGSDLVSSNRRSPCSVMADLSHSFDRTLITALGLV